MKPTQEQVIAWVRESSGVEFSPNIAGIKIGLSLEHLERFATLAYEAGRKDENEACAKMCEVKFDFCGDELLVAEAIRARMETNNAEWNEYRGREQ